MAASFHRTEILQVNRTRPESQPVQLAAAAIRRGEVIAMPTDTFYGLGADPFQPQAVERIFRIKRRPETRPILLLIDSMKRLKALVKDVPDVFRAIAAEFWPGPLTIILPASEAVPRAITAGSGTVAVRWPADAVVGALVRAAGRPLTGTSANISGRPAATTADEVSQQLAGRVSCILDAGPAPTRRPSTILDLTAEPRIVRYGTLPGARLARYLR